MSSKAGLTAPSSQPPGFLSRLAMSFSSPTRIFTEFSVEPTEPHRRYAPGDHVNGKVVIKLTKPVRITHLVLSLQGHAKVFKNGSTAGEKMAADGGQLCGRRSSECHGNGFALLFQEESTLCGEGRLDAGSFEVPFSMQFPSKPLPTSIDVSSKLFFFFFLGAFASNTILTNQMPTV
jgi:hypothetical protein